jgi:hypothetical protein
MAKSWSIRGLKLLALLLNYALMVCLSFPAPDIFLQRQAPLHLIEKTFSASCVGVANSNLHFLG